MKRMKVKFDDSLGVPVARGFLADGTPFNAIIDTGSEETVIDKDFIKENKRLFELEKTDFKINFMGIHGEGHTRIIRVAMDIFFRYKNGRKFSVFLNNGIAYDMSLMKQQITLKTDIPIHAIIGSKFFIKTNAEINYDTKELIFNICQTKTKK